MIDHRGHAGVDHRQVADRAEVVRQWQDHRAGLARRVICSSAST